MGTEERTFEQFVTDELGGLLRYAVLLTGDRELARDLVQDVLVAAHRNWGKISAADRPQAYVRKMVTNAHLSWRRRWSVRTIRLTREATLPEVVQPDTSSWIDDRDDMWRRLAALPRQQRVVLVLRFYERLTDAEIADILSCSAGTVRGYASRALATLRQQIESSETASVRHDGEFA